MWTRVAGAASGYRELRTRGAFWLVALLSVDCTQSKTAEDSYEVLLHSPSIVAQRAALNAILEQPQEYVPQIQQSLRDYPRVVQTDWVAATRSVHVATLVRDSSFAPILVEVLGDSAVIDECTYACPVVFALTVYSSFAGWIPPPTLDTALTTVTDLLGTVKYVSRMSLEIRPIDSVVSGPGLEKHRTSIDGKSEEQLIQIAGATASDEPGWLAATALGESVATSKNRVGLYLLLMNEPQGDASREYRGSIYKAIYRAETARSRGR